MLSIGQKKDNVAVDTKWERFITAADYKIENASSGLLFLTSGYLLMLHARIGRFLFQYQWRALHRTDRN